MNHHRLRQSGAWLRRTAVIAAALACGWALAQKIDDVPPAVQNGVAPNFMFMIDNSGSMNNIVPAAPYSASTTYQANCTGSNVVTVASGASVSVDLETVSGVPRIAINTTTSRGVQTTRLPHVTQRASSQQDGACFTNTATYNARLLADSGSTTRSPGSYLDTEYSGHFLNWYFGNFNGGFTGWSDRKVVTSGVVETRMEIARRSAKAAIDSLPVPSTGGRAVVRVGLSAYRTTSDGGALRIAMGDFDAAARTSLKDSIDRLTPGAQTPLATTFADIGRYMATGYNGEVSTDRVSSVGIDTLFRIDGTDNPTARNACLSNSPVSCSSSSATAAQKPIQQWCQRSSIFAVTDGRPQSDRGFNNNSRIRDYDGDCSGPLAASCVSSGAAGSWDRKPGRTYESAGSDYMDDVAMLLFDLDLRPDLQPATGRKTSKNNISTYMIGFADPAVQNDPLLINTARQGGGRFIAATDGPTLADAFRDVMTDALAKDAAAAAVAVTNAQITNGGVGYASSYSSGTWFGDLEAYSLDVTTGLKNGAVQWHARDQLNTQTAASRKIASYNGTAGAAFTAANGSAFRGATPALSDDLINYTRGDKSNEGATFRPRTWLLGDIINAEPVVVNYGTSAVVFQAANDGMLHAFDGRIDSTVATRGQELWAYVPALVHGKLAARANPIFQHEYLVDGTPATAQISGAGAVGRILVGGLAKGGAGYYALDITSGTAATEADVVAKVLWEFKPSNMGYSFGTPLIVNTANGWRVVVSSGLRNDSGTDGLGGDGRGHVWVLNPANGRIDREFVTPSGFGSSSAGLGLAYLAAPSNLPTGSATRFVYGGDLQGNVWRFDLTAPTGSAPVRVAAVTDPNGRAQPITSRPLVATVPGSATRFFIYFGTGQYFSVDDVPGTASPNSFASQVETIYGVVDDSGVSTPSLPEIRSSNNCNNGGNSGSGDFVCQVATQNLDGTFGATHNALDLGRRRGFYLDLPITGGRVNTHPALTKGGTLVVVVNKPSNVVCNPGGSSFLFQLSAANGGAVVTTYGGSDYYSAGFSLGDALSSDPLLVTSSEGPLALLRRSNKDTDSHKIEETRGVTPAFRRIYVRPLN